jgi:aspartate carbamoyltransferase regulatory subunit
MGNAKLLDNLDFLEKINLMLVSKIFPVKRTKILLLDKIEIDLRESRINQISIPPIPLPEITSDLSVVKPVLAEQKIAPTYVQIITCNNTQCSKKLRMQIDSQLIGRNLKIQCPICNHAFIYSLTKDELVEDFTTWLKEQLFYPEIETISGSYRYARESGEVIQNICDR